MSTKERVLEYLRTHKKITNLDAITYLNTFSLREAIRDLRQEGIQIYSKWIYENGKKWKEYSLEEN